MYKCINCSTDQVQRIRKGRWRVLCQCRRCHFKMYDTLSYTEIEGDIIVNETFADILLNVKDPDLDFTIAVDENFGDLF